MIKKIIKALDQSDLEGSINLSGNLSDNRYFILSVEIGYYGEDDEPRDTDIGPVDPPPILKEAKELPKKEEKFDLLSNKN